MPTNNTTFVVTDEHLVFLDALRVTGVTNMFGAQPYIRDEFPGLTETQARTVLVHWMKTFAARHPDRQPRPGCITVGGLQVR